MDSGVLPSDANREVVDALQREDENGTSVITFNAKHLNDKGEVVDPWGTPYRFYLSRSRILIRSAGPDCAFTHSDDKPVDDVYSSAEIHRTEHFMRRR